MPLDGLSQGDPHAALRAAGRAAALSVELAPLSAEARIARALTHPLSGPLALVSSFGAEAVVLLRLVAREAPDTPVLFLDTGMHFAETLTYQREVAELFGLSDLRIVRPDDAQIAAQDPGGLLHKVDADACCALRKVRPLAAALQGFDGWFTGRKRFQSRRRADLAFVEADGSRLKFNPLADWTPDQIAADIAAHNLPRHPLVAQGYPSIGCAPCTARPSPGADARAGRWAGQNKDECGIHLENGRIVRRPSGAATP
ncbi:MAG: phosphoadenylyl-sulfate reductase [Pseudomonadota bacterium]